MVVFAVVIRSWRFGLKDWHAPEHVRNTCPLHNKCLTDIPWTERVDGVLR